jgi:hypothetical protein
MTSLTRIQSNHRKFITSRDPTEMMIQSTAASTNTMSICGIPVSIHPMVKEHEYEYVLVFSVVLQSTFPTATDNDNNNYNNNINKNITIVALNNPKKHNAINMKMWNEIGRVFTQLHARQDCRSIILMGMGFRRCYGRH